MLIDRSDANAPNQAMVLSTTVTAEKKAYLKAGKHDDHKDFTVHSPVPYSIQGVLKEIRGLNESREQGAKRNCQGGGDFSRKLSCLRRQIGK